MNAKTMLLATALVLALCSCAAPAGDAGTDGPTSRSAGQTPDANPTTTTGDVPSELLDRAVADAAERAGVDPGQAQVVVAESVTWSDGSLGCPEPGMMYTQALVPGYRVIVDAGGEELHFHASENGQFVFCEDPQLPARTTE